MPEVDGWNIVCEMDDNILFFGVMLRSWCYWYTSTVDLKYYGVPVQNECVLKRLPFPNIVTPSVWHGWF